MLILNQSKISDAYINAKSILLASQPRGQVHAVVVFHADCSGIRREVVKHQRNVAFLRGGRNTGSTSDANGCSSLKKYNNCGAIDEAAAMGAVDLQIYQRLLRRALKREHYHTHSA